ncbi:MAG: metallophosphoesterase [Pseudomonadota bacterium]
MFRLSRLWQRRLRGATHGFVPRRLGEGLRVYAVGDVHGRLDLLLRLEASIVDDAHRRPPGEACRIVMLGDYVDRGPDTRRVLDHLLGPPPDGFDRHLLCGNHDWWLRRFVDDAGPAMPWLISGADAVMRSYGVHVDVRPDNEASLDALRRQLHRRMPAAHRRLLRGLVFSLQLGDYLFVHAGIRPGLALAQQDPHDLMFIREPFLSDRRDHGVVVVHGHTVTPEPVVAANRIGIDTGAYRTGILTAVVIDDTGIRFLATAP